MYDSKFHIINYDNIGNMNLHVDFQFHFANNPFLLLIENK